MVDTSTGKVERKFTMDHDEYEAIKDMAEKEDYVDFEIPKDAPMGKKVSESLIGIDNEQVPDSNDLEPVDLNDLFNE